MQIDKASAAVHYFSVGHHAFIACNDVGSRDEIVSSIAAALDGKPLQILDARSASDLQTFAEAVAHCCARLLHAIELDQQPRQSSLHAYLTHVETCFRSSNRQGYLIINHIDAVIEKSKNRIHSRSKALSEKSCSSMMTSRSYG